MIKLSVIIPIYNAENYLESCINSVLACPSGEVECILINDGSTDSSQKICNEYEKKDARIRLIHKEKEGVSVARNTGLELARGWYIMFLDADDYLDADKWNTILGALDECYDMIAFSYYTLWDNGKVSEELFPIIGKEARDVHTARKLLLTTASLNTCWGKLLRLQTIRNHSIAFKRGVHTGEDTLFILDFMEKAVSYSIRNQSILYYRQHQNSAMHSIEIEEKVVDFLDIYECRKRLADRYQDRQLCIEMNRQFFSVLTDLLLKASGQPSKQLKQVYCHLASKKMVDDIIGHTPFANLKPIYKKLEYLLLKYKKYDILTFYFRVKASFR